MASAGMKERRDVGRVVDVAYCGVGGVTWFRSVHNTIHGVFKIGDYWSHI